MAAQKGKAAGGKKKKTGKNNKPATQNKTVKPEDELPECIKELQVTVTAFLSVVERKLKKTPQQRIQASSLVQVTLAVVTACEDRVEEHTATLASVLEDLCDHETPTTFISALSDKFTKWASNQGLLFQYTRALVDGKTDPIEDATKVVDTAARDYAKVAQSVMSYSTKDKEEKETTGPSLDSMIEALSASGVEVSKEDTQSTSQSPKDPKQVAQAFLMFKPYMSQMIEARRKAEQQLVVLQTKQEGLSRRIEELEKVEPEELLSRGGEGVYQMDPRLTMESGTKEFMREHFKAFLSQYKLREEYFSKLLKARSSETAVQIMKVKKYRELSRAGWRMASEALESLSKVDERIQALESNFTDYKVLAGVTIESLVQEHESSKRDSKYLELEQEQSKNKTELMNVMMTDVVTYNGELKETLEKFKGLSEAWRVWADVCRPLFAAVLPEMQMQTLDGIMEKTETLVPREADDPKPPTDAEIEEMLRKGRLEGKTVEQVSQEVIAATENALKQARERRERRSLNSSVQAARVNEALAARTYEDDGLPTLQDVEGADVEAEVDDDYDSEAEVITVAVDGEDAEESGVEGEEEEDEGDEGDDEEEEDGEDEEEEEEDEVSRPLDVPPASLSTAVPTSSLPETPSAYAAALGPAPDSHLTVYSPVHSDEDKSREAAHDEADGEDDDDFGYKRYVAHEGDVSSEEDEYFLRAKFGICYHDRYSRKGKLSAQGPALNSYMSVFGGSADLAHNMCTHDMGTDFGQARFSDRRGHLFSEVLLHDYVQSDDDTSMQNWTDEVEWEEGCTDDDGDEDDTEDEEAVEDPEKAKEAEKAEKVKNAIAVASGAKEAPMAGTADAGAIAAELEGILFAKPGDKFNAVQIPEQFSEEEWKTLQSSSLANIIPLMLSYMVATFSVDGKLTLDGRFPSFVGASCNWAGAIATINFLTCYYSNSNKYMEKYGWNPIGRTIKAIGDLSGILDESRNVCPVTLDLVPFLLFVSRALCEYVVYPTWTVDDARDKALRNAVLEHEGFLSVEDLYRLVLEHRPPLWNNPLGTGTVYTTLLDALVRSFVSLYMRVSRFPFELDKLGGLKVVNPEEGDVPSKSVLDILTKIEERKSKFMDLTITRLEQALLHQASSALRRCITKNVYPEDTSLVAEKSVQDKVFEFLASKGGDSIYNKVVDHNRPMLMRALDSNQLDVERIAQLHDAYEKLDEKIESAGNGVNGTEAK